MGYALFICAERASSHQFSICDSPLYARNGFVESILSAEEFNSVRIWFE